jgi:hypothetical protein
VPGKIADAAFSDPEGAGLRRFVVAALYRAFVVRFGVDRVP